MSAPLASDVSATTTLRRKPALQTSPRLFLSGYTEVFKFGCDRRAVMFGIHLLVDVRDLALLVDVERPAICHAAFIQHAVRFRGVFGRVAEQGKIQIKFVRELLV